MTRSEIRLQVLSTREAVKKLCGSGEWNRLKVQRVRRLMLNERELMAQEKDKCQKVADRLGTSVQDMDDERVLEKLRLREGNVGHPWIWFTGLAAQRASMIP